MKPGLISLQVRPVSAPDTCHYHSQQIRSCLLPQTSYLSLIRSHSRSVLILIISRRVSIAPISPAVAIAA